MKLYIPNNLDIYALTRNTRPTFKPYNLDKLCYILHLINAIPIHNKDLRYEDFTPINAQQLQKKVDNYKDYHNYLINDLKIIESDNHYIPGEKSIGYRFIKEYRTKVKPWTINYFPLRKALKVAKNKKDLSVKHLNYLTKWFNPKLEIDFELVNWFLAEEYNIKKNRVDLWDKKKPNKKRKIKTYLDNFKNPNTQKEYGYYSALKIHNNDFSLLLDDSVYRFHTNLTNMPSIVRNAITYNGEELISIDVKNCQPYLSTILLSRSFWIEEKMNANKQEELSISFSEPQSDINAIINKLKDKYSINNNKTIDIKSININKYDSYIMLGDIAEHLNNKGFQQYIDLVVNGELYEYLKEQFFIKLGIDLKDRKEVKTAVFQVLFTDNRFFGQDDAKPKQLFKGLFPEVYKIFSLIKQKDKTVLPRLLQSMESYLMINVIAKRIAKEFPKAPIYTIHDSIATTQKYIKDVKRIMNEELTIAIGHPPVLKEEPWNKNELHKNLNNLKEKAKVLA